MRGDVPAVDTDLLQGAEFGCLPECGLCCFASPAVTAEERPRLLQIDPELGFDEARGDLAYLQSQGDGGACRALASNRCRVYPARPFPCREFPLIVHLGARAQVGLVLSCPGLHWGTDGTPPRGLDGELSSVTAELGRVRWVPWVRQQSHRWSRRFPGASPFAARYSPRDPEALHWAPRPEEFPAPDPPSPEDGLEFLPVFHDAEYGQLVLGAHAAGWEVFRLRPEGGAAASLGVFAPPTQPPTLSEAAHEVLNAYQAIVASRDATLWAAALDAEGTGELEEAWRAAVREAGALALSRAAVLRELHGRVGGPLSAADVLVGVRATDAEVLDRPTWGRRL